MVHGTINSFDNWLGKFKFYSFIYTTCATCRRQLASGQYPVTAMKTFFLASTDATTHNKMVQTEVNPCLHEFYFACQRFLWVGHFLFNADFSRFEDLKFEEHIFKWISGVWALTNVPSGSKKLLKQLIYQQILKSVKHFKHFQLFGDIFASVTVKDSRHFSC